MVNLIFTKLRERGWQLMLHCRRLPKRGCGDEDRAQTNPAVMLALRIILVLVLLHTALKLDLLELVALAELVRAVLGK